MADIIVLAFTAIKSCITGINDSIVQYKCSNVCKINNNMIDEVLEIELDLKYHRKPLKPLLENHKFKLHKVEQDTETTFEVLLH